MRMRASWEGSQGSPGCRRPTCEAEGRGSAWGLRLAGVCVPGVLLGQHGQVPTFLCPFLPACGGFCRRSLLGTLTLETPQRPVLDQGALGILSTNC